MRRQVVIWWLLLITFPSLLFAEIVFQHPTVAKLPVTIVEAGAGAKQTLQYKNNTASNVTIDELQMTLSYDPAAIDNIFSIDNEQTAAFNATFDTATTGAIRCSMTALHAGTTIRPGESINLLTIAFHVNQLAASRRSVELFAVGECHLYYSHIELERQTIAPHQIYLEESNPPDFVGLIKVESTNAQGIKNPGNVLLLDWRGSGFDRTFFEGNKLNYRVFRRTKDSAWEEISGGGTPPYLGNLPGSDCMFEDKTVINGTEYIYKVTAQDNTSPTPNEQTSVREISATPQDLQPPSNVTDVTVVADDNLVTLSWKNPADVDLAGVVIARADDKSIDGFLSPTNTSEEPWGPGNGRLLFSGFSPADPETGVCSWQDTSAQNGLIAHYKLFAFDNQYNYAPGVSLVIVAGKAPAPISNLAAIPDRETGKGIVRWTKSPSIFAGGTLIRYSTDKKLKFDALKDSASGEFFDFLPQDYTLGSEEAFLYSGFDLETTYYLKAWAINQACIPFDPSDMDSYSRFYFSSPVTTSIFIPSPAVTMESMGVESGRQQGTKAFQRQLSGPPLCFPNPFNPERDKKVTIQYALTKDAPVEIYIFDLSSTMVKRINCAAGAEGGRGQINKVQWDGMTEQGPVASSGTYLGTITLKDEKRIVGKFKLMVYR